MAYSETEIRSVRLLIPDTEAVFGDANEDYIFPDEDIEVFLTLGKGSPAWAAGLAMIAVGNSEALIGKVMRNYETETDASKLQKEWRVSGLAMIEQGKADLLGEEESFFIVAYPEWGATRHPEGYTHGAYRLPVPDYLPTSPGIEGPSTGLDGGTP
jgi:hypothetical protein